MSARKFPAVPESVPAARRFVRDTLSDQPRELVQAAELMTSELATNCIQHANTDFELAIDAREQIRVEVRDSHQGEPQVQFPTPEDQSGRGLRIVEAMSDAWGVIPSSQGKTVWFALQAQADGARETERSSASGGRESEAQTRAAPASAPKSEARVRERARRRPSAHRAAGQRSGSRTCTCSPPPGRASRLTLPSWALAIACTIDSPRPCPSP
jgi:anti-sigma regulatory factor (Ser/Thr protein kinase)